MTRFSADWADRLATPGDDEFPDEMPKIQSIGQAASRILPNLELAAMVSGLTESPIETMLAVAIMRAFDDVELRAPGAGFGRYWTLIPQYPWGRYRVDFALRKPDGSLIFLECDGYEFHSTPEQIARDEARQREMNDAGFPVIRVTGSDINYNAEECASRLYRYRWSR